MTPSDAAGGTVTTGDNRILAPTKVNISARPAFRKRSLPMTSARRKYMDRRPKMANTLDV